MFARLNKDTRGQAFVEALFVIPLVFMLFIFTIEMGFMMYNWAVLNFQTSNAAVVAATKGQFSDEVRLRLAENISDWTINSRGYDYDITGTDSPGVPDGNTVYVYGTDRSTPIQRGSYINVNINYPWHFKFFMVDSLTKFIVSEQKLRLKVNTTVSSEVFNESLL